MRHGDEAAWPDHHIHALSDLIMNTNLLGAFDGYLREKRKERDA